MTMFAEILHEVRSERHITQEQLAKEMNVSRQTISHWENGRAVPDIDTIKHLSQVLDYNFLAVEGMIGETQPAPDAGEIPAQPEAESAQKTPTRLPEITSRKKRFVLPAVLGGVLLCAVLIVFLLMNGSSSREQANVLVTPIENPVYAIRLDDFLDGVGWRFGFTIEETAGIPFTIQEVNEVAIADDGEEFPHIYSGEWFTQWYGSDTLTKGVPQRWTSGFPLQNCSAVRLMFKGVDANGNALTFEGSLELLKEIAE